MARAIIGRYPAVWRQRYADEILALIDAQTLRWRDVADLARRCLIERARALFEPGDHPFLASMLAGGANGGFSLLTGIVMAIVALSLARGLAGVFGPGQDWLMIPAFLIICAGWFRQFRDFSRRNAASDNSVPRPADRLRRAVAWAITLFASVVILQWGTESTMQLWSSSFWIALLFAYQFDRLWPSNGGLPQALMQRASALEGMKWARMELTRCETLAAEGSMTNDLARAQAEMHRLQTVYDDAMRVLHGMGYRAKFQ